jgi:acyl-CoA dehydrogenase
MIDTEQIGVFLDTPHIELAVSLGSFVEAEIGSLPHPADDAQARLQAREILERLGQGDLARFAVPDESTGSIDLRACCLIRESLAAASPLADAVFALQCLGSHPIALGGSEELKERWLPAVASGKAMAAFAMTEPEAGSDVGSMTTTATADGDGYLLEGRKILISNAGIADFYTLFARTDPDGRSRGISAFVVPADTPGLEFVGPQVMSEPHPLGEIALENCRVPSSARLGAEGEGFKIGMRTLDRLRATVAAAACGMATRAFHEAMHHARSRRQFGKAIAEFQLIQQKLARMSTDLAAARLLVYRAAHKADRGAERVTLESAMAKAYATEAAQRIVDDAVQIIGGRGVLADHPVDRLYRAVRSLRIYEGATEIQQLVIARELLKGDMI